MNEQTFTGTGENIDISTLTFEKLMEAKARLPKTRCAVIVTTGYFEALRRELGSLSVTSNINLRHADGVFNGAPLFIADTVDEREEQTKLIRQTMGEDTKILIGV